MSPIAFLLLCLAVHVNSATLPNIEVLLPPTVTIDAQLNSYLDNPITVNRLNEIEPNICTTEICEKESAIMLSTLDENVDPCDNFYEFACGKFLRDTILPEDKAIIMSFTQVQEIVEEQLRSVLTEKPQLNESNPFELAKIFNSACLNEESLKENGITPMVEILDKIGGWAVVRGDGWDERNWDWMDANRKISNEGLVDSFVLSVNIMVDTKNSSKRSISLDQARFGLGSKFLLKGIEDTNVRAYYDFMVDAAVIFGANKSNAEPELLDSLQFEIALAKIALPAEERRNLTLLYNPYTVQQLQKTAPYMNWLEYINWNLNNVLKVDENEIVIVLDKNYIQQLETLLQSTPKRTIANYFAWRSVYFASGLLNDVLHDRRQQYLATSTGMLKSDPREKECVKRTMDYLSTSVGALYVHKYFNEESKKGAASLVKSIHEEFLETLKNVPWMDETSRVAAIEKAHKMNYHIAYPDELVDNSKLEEYYHGLELETDSLLQNVLRIRKFNSDHAISKLRLPVNKTDWETHSFPTVVNAFYSLLENSIQIPAAVLQDRFFSIDRPSYMNYGYIGWFIGHELTHGFDDEGRQFDSNGNLVDWWQEDTARKFASRAQCIIDQYSNYTDPSMTLRINGVNTQGENIADNGAVKGMYSAYQKFVERNGPEPILPGLNYTQNQLFWISAAQLWCAVTRPEFDTVQYTTDVHAPNKFRIIGTFSNMETFAQDFKCAPGSKMNPVNKCHVW